MTRTGWFIYNGFDTRSLGLAVMPGDIDCAPARNFLVHAHGGANGDFVVDTGRFDNVPRTYTIMIRGNFRATYDALCNALLPMKGYQRLTDMWAPDEYFMAYLSGPLEPTVSPDEDRGTVLVSFTRQPQRWLLSGETWELTRDADPLINPTSFLAWPAFRIQINPNLTDAAISLIYGLIFPEINGIMPQFRDHDYTGSLLSSNRGEWIAIDYKTGHAGVEGKPAYDGGLNSRIKLEHFDPLDHSPIAGFPALNPGSNHVFYRQYPWSTMAYVRWGWYTV